MALPPASPDSLQRLALACAHCRRCGLAEGRQQVVVARAMPMSNATGLTDAERQLIKQWFEAGARTD